MDLELDHICSQHKSTNKMCTHNRDGLYITDIDENHIVLKTMLAL